MVIRQTQKNKQIIWFEGDNLNTWGNLKEATKKSLDRCHKVLEGDVHRSILL